MKKIFKIMKEHILLSTIIFMGIYIFLYFILYLLDIKFRSWFNMTLLIISILGMILGVIQIIIHELKVKKLYTVVLSIFAVILTISISIFLVIICYQKEHVTIMNEKKYVVVTHIGFHDIDEYYYDYLGPFFRGRKVRINGYSNDLIGNIFKYTYYDNDGRVIDKNPVSNYNPNDYYILPEEQKVLYEKKFDDTMIKITECGSALGQKIGFCVLRSIDGGKNFYRINKNDQTVVSTEVKFVFLDENLGFAISTGDLRIEDSLGLYVTQDGGETWESSKLEYKDNYSVYLYVDSNPYFENGNLKFKWRDYKTLKDYIELTFVSKDNGLTWKVENKKDMIDYEQ